MKDTTIIIATYGKRLESNYNMLPDILESIKALHEKGFRVVVINNTRDRSYNEKIKKTIDQTIKPFKKHFKIEQFSYEDLESIHKFLTLHSHASFLHTLVFGGYSNFRNLGLLIGVLLKSKIVIFLDDDEIIEDKAFLKKAREFIGNTYKGKVLGGIAGYYINKSGSYFLPKSEMERWWSVFWNKTKHMNEAFKIIGKNERLLETTFAFGGNMVLHEQLYTVVPFDPHIPRGEDIDMLINAKAYGFAFPLDNQLAVKHLHPPRTHGEWWLDMRRDAYRFVYERKKIIEFIKDKRLPADSIKMLDPYPGQFLKKRTYLHFIATAILLAIDSALSLQFNSVAENLRNIRIVLFEAKKYAKENCRKYFNFQQKWVQLVRDIAQDKKLVSHFKDKFG